MRLADALFIDIIGYSLSRLRAGTCHVIACMPRQHGAVRVAGCIIADGGAATHRRLDRRQRHDRLRLRLHVLLDVRKRVVAKARRHALLDVPLERGLRGKGFRQSGLRQKGIRQKEIA